MNIFDQPSNHLNQPDFCSKNLAEILQHKNFFLGKKIVIKFGGNILKDKTNLIVNFTQNLAFLHILGFSVVLVHGGGPEIEKLLNALKIESKFIDGMRYTSNEAIEIVNMTLSGSVNKFLVSLVNKEINNLSNQLAQNNFNDTANLAVGISGVDANLLTAKKLNNLNGKPIDIGQAGEIEQVNLKLINSLLANNFLPIISPISNDVNINPLEKSSFLNVNADTVAAACAQALKADCLIYFTNIEGVKDASENIVNFLNSIKIKQLIENKVITDGMLPKITSALNSCEKGVKSVHIVGVSTNNALLNISMSNFAKDKKELLEILNKLKLQPIGTKITL